MNNYQPRAPHPRRRAAKPRHVTRLGNVMQQAGDPWRTTDDRIDPPGDFREGQADLPVDPPAADLLADLLQGVLADRGQEPHERTAVPVLRAALAEREPQEGERRVLIRAPPPLVLAVPDPGLAGMQPQPDLLHPVPEGSQHLAGLPLSDAVHHRVSGRGESHPPALAEPDLNLSTHPAPIAQPSGRAPSRQCANSRGDLRAAPASSSIARRSRLRSRLSYFRQAHRTRWSLSRRRK